MDADRQADKVAESDARRRILEALTKRSRERSRVLFEPHNLWNPPPSVLYNMTVRG